MNSAAEPPRVSLIWATLNERANLPVLVERLRAVALPPYEVLVVDDGSRDGTREFVTELSRSDPRFRLLVHDGRQTTVRAQGQGIAVARGEYVVVMDADLQHPPERVPDLLSALDRGATVAVASRYVAGGSPGPRERRRALYSYGAEFIARISLSAARKVTDPVSGYFAFRRSIYRPLDPAYRGYKLLLFVLVMSRGRGVDEIPFRFEPRAGGASKVTEGFAFVRVFLAEVRFARRFARQTRHAPAPTGGTN
jgi:dolichol-phosphate mannosyltransferase